MNPADDREREEFLAKHGSKPVTLKSLLNQLDALAPVIIGAIDKRQSPILKRIELLERENAELKAAVAKTFADCYRGTWQPAAFDPYPRGIAVTHDGSLWLARTETRAKPGTNDDWQMIVKRGRDGKDAA